MAGLHNDIPNKRPVPENVRRDANTYEDEITLVDYVRILWKRKCVILLGSVLPALAFGLVIFSLPRDYKVTYTYDMGLNEKEYKTLLDKFYSGENLDRVISKLEENGLNKYARKIAQATVDELKGKLVGFEVSPSFFETMETLKMEDVKEIAEIQRARGTLLAMIIKGRPKKDMATISLVVRDNFEKIIPMYSVTGGLNNTIIGLKSDMAAIEENRYTLELDLAKKRAILTKLRDLKPGESGQIASDIILQFGNVAGNSAYLPLPYQIQAVESTIIDLEENIKANEQKYGYYSRLLGLNQRLFDEVKKAESPYYTIQQYHPFLTSILNEYEDKELVDYLNAYIKKIENSISVNIPIMEVPKVYPVPKGTVKKSAIVFAIFIIITTFAAFLLEAAEKSRVRPSRAL
jgi:hypothetical protein